MKLPTIVVVNDFASVEGGATQVALTSAAALDQAGYQVHLLAAVGPVADSIAQSRVAVTLLNQQPIADDSHRLRAMRQGVWNAAAYRAMRRLLADCDPAATVVHLHVWVKSLSSAVARAALDAGFSVVVTLHDFFLACPNGGFYNYREKKICHLTPMSLACATSNCDKRNYGHKIWRLLRQQVQQTNGKLPGGLSDFITISDFSEAIMRPFLPEAARLHRVANPIIVKKNDKAQVADNEDFLFVGRLDPEKGPELFAQAALTASVKAVFIGRGSCFAEVKKIMPSAELTGWLGAEELAARLITARALVFPSLWYETQGLTVLEAAAVGVPAIVPDTCAASEMVQGGVTGLVFKSGDVKDLSAKIQVFKNAEVAARFGQAAYERYWARPCTIERHINELGAVYQKILARSTGAGSPKPPPPAK